jgi:hypothetical protein
MLVARLGAKMDSLFSFLVGLFHRQQHADLIPLDAKRPELPPSIGPVRNVKLACKHSIV